MRYERSTSSFLERDRRIQETGNLLEEEGRSFSLQRNITIQEKTKAEHLTLLTESRPRSKVHSET